VSRTLETTAPPAYIGTVKVNITVRVIAASSRPLVKTDQVIVVMQPLSEKHSLLLRSLRAKNRTQN
ncbi:MAG: hypothetical protein MJK13_16355, partial [Pseudomonadales bacterium]|nr:hypothetical protein [Pseudomonadales bacterium]